MLLPHTALKTGSDLPCSTQYSPWPFSLRPKMCHPWPKDSPHPCKWFLGCSISRQSLVMAHHPVCGVHPGHSYWIERLAALFLSLNPLPPRLASILPLREGGSKPLLSSHRIQFPENIPPPAAPPSAYVVHCGSGASSFQLENKIAALPSCS